jgi:hypothetical protein
VERVPLTYPARWLADDAVRDWIVGVLGGEALPVHEMQDFAYRAPLAVDGTYALEVICSVQEGDPPRITIAAEIREGDALIGSAHPRSSRSASEQADERSRGTRHADGRPDRCGARGVLRRCGAGPQPGPSRCGLRATPGPERADRARMFVMGQFERVIRGWATDHAVEGLSIRFAKPVPVGAVVTVQARLARATPLQEGSVRTLLRLVATVDRGVVAIGTATVTGPPLNPL